MNVYEVLFKVSFAYLQLWDDVSKWPNSLYIQQTGFHGGDFIGGDCLKLLRNVDVLASICPLHIVPFVQALRDFHQVVISCFGRELHPDFREHLDKFATSYRDIGISVTPKVHIVIAHVGDFCEQANSGLGPYSEQAFESAHKVFQNFWSKHLVKDLENPSYPHALLKSVVEFNSKHV